MRRARVVAFVAAWLLACGGEPDLLSSSQELAIPGDPHPGMAANICPPEDQGEGWTCHWNDCSGCHSETGYYPWLRCLPCQRCKHGHVRNCKPCFTDEDCKSP